MSIDSNSTETGRTRRRVLMAAAAVLVLGGGIALAINRGSSDDGGAPTDTAPDATSATTAPPTTAPPTTAPPALSDRDIATATLLDPSEYQAGWSEFKGFMVVTMSGTRAAQVPGCAPYVDTALIGQSNPAAEAARTFTLAPDFYGQYVAVFPTEDAARAMFAAISDNQFLTNCAGPYFDVQYSAGEWVPVGGPSDGEVPVLDLPGDEVFLSHGAGDFTRADGSPGHFDAVDARVRVGRVIIQVTGADPRFQTNDEFTAAVTRAVERATAALAGTPLP